jgi:hypothetical protein
MELGAKGGEFTLPVDLKPAACPVSIAFSAPWIRMTDQAGLRFTVEANDTTATRDALIVVGDRTFFLRQTHPPQSGLAAVPSRLVFGVNKEGASDAQVITAWAERALGNFTARSGRPWLVITPKKANRGRQVFEVTVRPNSGLKPGRYDAEIVLVPGGASKRSLTIPVVVEVAGVL